MTYKYCNVSKFEKNKLKQIEVIDTILFSITFTDLFMDDYGHQYTTIQSLLTGI